MLAIGSTRLFALPLQFFGANQVPKEAVECQDLDVDAVFPDPDEDTVCQDPGMDDYCVDVPDASRQMPPAATDVSLPGATEAPLPPAGEHQWSTHVSSHDGNLPDVDYDAQYRPTIRKRHVDFRFDYLLKTGVFCTNLGITAIEFLVSPYLFG